MSPKFAQDREMTYRLHKAVFLLDKMADQILQDKLGFGFSQMLVLLALADMPKVPQKAVAKALDETQAAVSRQVDILVGLKLVSRETNPANRREYVLGLTRLGHQRLRDGFEAVDSRFGRLFNVWTKREKAVMAEALDRLNLEIKTRGADKICGRAG